MAFEFENDRDRDQIMDLSPWLVQDHCLNPKTCKANMCLEETNFNELEIWIQIHDLNLDMDNTENAQWIRNNIGRRISVGADQITNQHNLLRIKIEINTDQSLMVGFWWTNMMGQEKWATIKYEGLLDFCYGCGRLGHMSQYCEEEVTMFEQKTGFPLYGPWLQGSIPRINRRWYNLGGRK